MKQARDPSMRVSSTLRISEWLRSELERSAEVNDVSLNAEISRRLERSFEGRQIIAELFGSKNSINLLTTIAMGIKLVEARFDDEDWARSLDSRRAVGQVFEDVLSAFAIDMSDQVGSQPETSFKVPDPIGREAATKALRATGLQNLKNTSVLKK